MSSSPSVVQIIENELTVGVDVDGTLVLNLDYKTPTSKVMIFDYYGTPKTLVVHDEHVELVKSYKARGFFITVHSANGVQWAHEIITKLGLIDYVNLIKTKDIKLVDDLEVGPAFGQRVFIPYISSPPFLPVSKS